MTDHMHVVKKESKEAKAQRRSSQKKFKEDRKEKRRLRDKKEKLYRLRLQNLCTELGVGYDESGYTATAIRERWENKRAVDLITLSEEAREFLRETFPFHIRKDNWDVDRIHFDPVDLTEKEADAPNAPPSRTLLALTKLAKQPYSVVESVYSALVNLARQQLTKHRKFRLPGLARLSVRYRPALPARKGMNPWKKVVVSMPASPAQNRLRAKPDRELREWAEKYIPVVPPAKKKTRPKKEKSKRKHHKKYTRYFDTQKDFHIA